MMTRDETGRFKKGSAGGPGRPRRTTEAEYLVALQSGVNIDDWNAIIVRAVLDAKRGDHVARKWLADYLIGPPVERKEITGADGATLSIQIVRDDASATN